MGAILYYIENFRGDILRNLRFIFGIYPYLLFNQPRSSMWVLISRISLRFTYGTINDGKYFYHFVIFLTLVVRNRLVLGPGPRFEKRISYGKGVM